MSNLLPSSVNGYITVLIGLSVALMGAYLLTIPSGQGIPLWAVILNAGINYLALWIKGGGGLGGSVINNGGGK